MFSKLLLIVVLFYPSLYLSCYGLTSSQTNFESAINKTVKYLENVSKVETIPGIVAGVNINGTTVWSQAFGLIDIENDVKTRVDSVWRMASISKSLTSALIGRLIDEKRLDLNKSIHEYLKPTVFPIKQWNNKNVTITLGQVMSHTAGLHVMEWPNDLLQKFIFNNVTDTIELFKDSPLLFAPGSHWNYSNYGFQVVGAVIESVLNETYESAINKMFKELDMNSTFCERREHIIAHRARYYMLDTTDKEISKLINTVIYDDLISLEAQWPSGGIVSTVPDLLKFGAHINKWSKGVNESKTFNLNPGTVSKLLAPVIDIEIPSNTNDTFQYAHGWFVITLKNPIVCTRCKVSPIKRVVAHSGGLEGVNTLLVLSPENDIGVAIFLNRVLPDKLQDVVFAILKNFVE